MRRFPVSALILVILMLPAATFAAEGHHPASLWDLKFYFLNFAIFVYILLRILREPFARALTARREHLAGAIRGASERLNAIDAQLAKVNRRLSQIAGEGKAIESELVSEGDAEATRIIEESEKKAVRVQAQAERMADAERRATIQQLRRELADAVIARAREEIQGKMSSTRDAELRGVVAKEAGTLLQ